MAEGYDKSIVEEVRKLNNKVTLCEKDKELAELSKGLDKLLLNPDDTTRSLARRQTDIAVTTTTLIDVTKQLTHDFELSKERQISLLRAEKELEDSDARVKEVDERVKQVKATQDNDVGRNGYLPWIVPINNIQIPRGNVDNRLRVQSSGILKFQNGLKTWEFRLFLNPNGLNGQFVSLTVTLLSSPSQLSTIFPGTLTIKLLNMDQIHLPTDQRKPRPDFSSTIPPDVLSTSQPSYQIDNFFPHTVFGLAQGFVLEEHVKIEVKAEMRDRSKKQNEDDEWLMDNDSCEKFESSS